MNHTVMIISKIFDSDDIQDFNENEREIIYSNYTQVNFNETETALIVVSLMQTIGHNAIYDTLKYIFLSLAQKIHQKWIKAQIDKSKEFSIVVSYGEKKFSLKMKGTYSESQTEKIVDAATKKLLDL